MNSLLMLLRAQYAHLQNKANRRRNAYHFQSRYVPIMGTQRHCNVHPARLASHFQLNTQDRSYRRPVCATCVEQG